MTIASETRRAGPYAGNGVTQVFAFSFKTFSQDDLVVVTTTAGVDTVLTLTTHYTVSLNGDQDASPGGSVTILTAPATGTNVSILSDRSLLQALNLQNAGAFLAANVNAALDNIVIGLQQVADQQSRGIRGALSDPEWDRLPAAEIRAGGLLGFDDDGQPIVADVAGIEGIASDIATVAGISAQVQIVAAADVDVGTVAVNIDAVNEVSDWIGAGGEAGDIEVVATGSTEPRTLGDRFALSVKDFGAVGDGVTDDTAALQAAFDQGAATGAAILLNAGIYRATSQITLADPVTIIGETPTLPDAYDGDGVKAPEGGSWLWFDHAGTGLYCRDDASVGVLKTETVLRNFGTYRTHPTPGGGWSPTVYGPDVRVEYRVRAEDMLLLNPYDGFYVRSAGVLTTKNLKGQALNRMINCERASDRQVWDGVHIWPFWSQDSNVVNYTINNADAIYVRRADGLQINNLFSYGYRWLAHFKDEDGDLSGAAGWEITAAYADKAGGAVLIESDYYRNYGSIFGLLVNSDADVGGAGAGVHIRGAVASQVLIDGFEVTRAHEQSLLVEGAAHMVTVSPKRIADWDRLAGGDYAFDARDGARIQLLNLPVFSSGQPEEYFADATPSYIFLPIQRSTSGLITLPGPSLINTNAGDVRITDLGGNGVQMLSVDDGVSSPTTTKVARFHSGTTAAVPDVTIVDADNNSARSALSVKGGGGAVNIIEFRSNGVSEIASYHSYRFNIPDDGVASFLLPGPDKVALIRLCPTSVPAALGPVAEMWVRCTGSPSIQTQYLSHSGNFDISTGVLTGTTGTDGNLRVSAASDGRVYIENRVGGARTFVVDIMGN